MTGGRRTACFARAICFVAIAVGAGTIASLSLRELSLIGTAMVEAAPLELRTSLDGTLAAPPPLVPPPPLPTGRISTATANANSLRLMLEIALRQHASSTTTAAAATETPAFVRLLRRNAVPGWVGTNGRAAFVTDVIVNERAGVTTILAMSEGALNMRGPEYAPQHDPRRGSSLNHPRCGQYKSGRGPCINLTMPVTLAAPVELDGVLDAARGAEQRHCAQMPAVGKSSKAITAVQIWQCRGTYGLQSMGTMGGVHRRRASSLRSRSGGRMSLAIGGIYERVAFLPEQLAYYEHLGFAHVYIGVHGAAPALGVANDVSEFIERGFCSVAVVPIRDIWDWGPGRGTFQLAALYDAKRAGDARFAVWDNDELLVPRQTSLVGKSIDAMYDAALRDATERPFGQFCTLTFNARAIAPRPSGVSIDADFDSVEGASQFLLSHRYPRRAVNLTRGAYSKSIHSTERVFIVDSHRGGSCLEGALPLLGVDATAAEWTIALQHVSVVGGLSARDGAALYAVASDDLVGINHYNSIWGSRWPIDGDRVDDEYRCVLQNMARASRGGLTLTPPSSPPPFQRSHSAWYAPRLLLAETPATRRKIVAVALAVGRASPRGHCKPWKCDCAALLPKVNYTARQFNGATDKRKQWFLTNRCLSMVRAKEGPEPCDAWKCNCQTFSNTFGTSHMLGWGVGLALETPENEVRRAWWIKRGCRTKASAMTTTRAKLLPESHTVTATASVHGVDVEKSERFPPREWVAYDEHANSSLEPLSSNIVGSMLRELVLVADVDIPVPSSARSARVYWSTTPGAPIHVQPVGLNGKVIASTRVTNIGVCRDDLPFGKESCADGAPFIIGKHAPPQRLLYGSTGLNGAWNKAMSLLLTWDGDAAALRTDSLCAFNVSFSIDAATWSVPTLIATRAAKRKRAFVRPTQMQPAMNARALDPGFEHGVATLGGAAQSTLHRGETSQPWWPAARRLHPCCATWGYLDGEEKKKKTPALGFAALRYRFIDVLRAQGNGSRIVLAGDSVTRESFNAALCDAVAAGATVASFDFPQEMVQYAHSGSFCIRGGSTLGGAGDAMAHDFRRLRAASVVLRVPSSTTAGRPSVHTVTLDARHVGGEFKTFVQELELRPRDALVLNAGVWYNVGNSRKMGLVDKDSPLQLFREHHSSFAAVVAKVQKMKVAPFVFWRETTPQIFANLPLNSECLMLLQRNASCPKNPTCSNFCVGGEFPPGQPCSPFTSRGDAWDELTCVRNGSLGWSTAVPYRWRQRIAFLAACAAGLDVVTPLFEANLGSSAYIAAQREVARMSCASARDAAASARGATAQAGARLHWIPFFDAAMQMRHVYHPATDCTHPGKDPALWAVVWDGMARHILAAK